jgi:hypothetical protein
MKLLSRKEHHFQHHIYYAQRAARSSIELDLKVGDPHQRHAPGIASRGTNLDILIERTKDTPDTCGIRTSRAEPSSPCDAAIALRCTLHSDAISVAGRQH